VGDVIFDRLSARVPGTDRLILSGVSLSIPRGSIVGVIGPSGAGKSTLVRVLSGVWPVAGGFVRIDGSDIRDWNAPELGQHVGYLPQDIELFSGTVAQNICRFREDATEDDIIGAAKLAGVHELIQGLPQGYNTMIGENGSALSGGQRQRLGLARAVFGLPPLVILDEPNSNLDFAGESSLINAVIALRDVQVTVIFITHKMSMLSQADKVLVLNAGQVQAFGEREEVLAAVAQANVAKHAPNVQAVTAARKA
jgi:ABC-type protease/lipase transport system fused ATPase/permease subunit